MHTECFYVINIDLVLVICHGEAYLSPYSYVLLAKLQDTLLIIDTNNLKAFLSDAGIFLRKF